MTDPWQGVDREAVAGMTMNMHEYLKLERALHVCTCGVEDSDDCACPPPDITLTAIGEWKGGHASGSVYPRR